MPNYKAALRQLLKPLVRISVDRGFLGPIPMLCARQTRVIEPSAGPRPSTVTILALSSHRFMGDLRALAATGRFRIVLMPEYWQFAGLNLYPKGESKRLGPFLAHFIAALARRYHIRLVLGTSLWYRFDIPWGRAAEHIGIPYVCLHKECFKTEPAQLSAVAARASRVGPFAGTMLVLHNEVIRDLLVSSGFVTAEKSCSLGAMRMDRFVSRVRACEDLRANNNGRHKVTFFSFTQGIGFDDLGADPFPKNRFLGWTALFRDTHVAVAELARENSELDVVIKTKWGGEWFDLIDQALQSSGLERRDIRNLTLDCTSDAHDLVFASDVVTTFSSTTLLEAAVAGRPVVVPNFGEAVHPLHFGRVKLRAEYDAFEVANSPEDLKMRILAHLNGTTVASTDQKRRHEGLFERWISPMDQGCLDRYCSMLEKVASQSAGCALAPKR